MLTIAGFDPSSGAGVTADLQTFAAHGLFGTSAITALTVQSTRGVATVHPSDPDVLRRTLQELSADLPPQGIKIGMLGSPEVIDVVAEFLGTRRDCPVVLDPVLRSSSGRDLLPVDAVDRLKQRLLPLVGCTTPNWSELALLSGRSVKDVAGAQRAAEVLGGSFPKLCIVATGGDRERPVDLVRLPGGRVYRFEGEHIPTRSTHGTGCAFSSALLSELVHGRSPVEAVAAAKAFVEGALRRAPGLGHGRGPMDLLWPLRGESDAGLLG